VDNNGDSPVHWLAALGKVELLKLLPKDELLKSNAKNWTTLHFAIERKEMETALWLAKTYPELTETKTADGQTPSELAVAYGFLTDDEVFQLANCIPSRTECANIQDRPRSPKDVLLLKAQSNEVELTYLRNLVDRHDQKLKEIEKRLKNIDGLSSE
jgi:ankyrin repeat protein